MFHFWTGVSVIAGALRRRVWIDQRWFEWTPNFYIIFVAPPGVAAKSTTARIGMDLLRYVPGIKWGPKSITWQALLVKLQEAQEMMKLGDEFYPMACVTSVVTELGTFLKPEDSDMVDVLVDLWDGQKEAWDRATKTQGGTDIENPWINVIGCTTPSWMKKNFPDYLIGGGLTSRIIFIWAEKKRKFTAYPARVIKASEYAEYGQRLVQDLTHISKLQGPMELEPSAEEWGEVWYKKLWADRPLHMASDRFSGYIARKQTHVHKLAMVLSAAEGDSLRITVNHLQMADRLVTALEADMAKVFESIGVSDTSKNIKELVTYVRAYEGISLQDLWRHCMPIMGRRDFSEAVEGAIQAGFVEQRHTGRQYVFVPVKPKQGEK